MNILVNPITTHKHARWIALIAFGVGYLCMLIGALLPDDWGAYVLGFGLLIWYIPVAWSALQWSKGGKK